MNFEDFAIFIPIKDGKDSNRLPNKNFFDFNGKPLYEKVIEWCKERIVGVPIYISTQCDISHIEGVTWIHRPPEFDLHDEPISVVYNHAKEFIEEEHVILIQVTNPLRKISTVYECIRQYLTLDGKKAVVAVDRYFKPTGAAYVWPKDKWLWDCELFVIRDDHYCGDIDHLYDLRIAEAVERGNYS